MIYTWLEAREAAESLVFRAAASYAQVLVRLRGSYITPWNPASVVAAPEQNDRQNAALARELTARGVVFYSGFGVPDEPTWTPEASFLAIGIDEADATALGQQFGQAAIVVGTVGTLPRLVWC